jgi:hypothetical protein
MEVENIKNILEEYRNADAEKRLYLFLSHRSLRDEFIAIDQSEAGAEFSKKAIKKKYLMCGNWRQCLMASFK